mmetsp:Transcript_10313/g.24764  ORF Transcript_10313/g.24764 Transcript_10313/m.24764 type:complete len:208 (+) Transcript_10313:196-819(+)
MNAGDALPLANIFHHWDVCCLEMLVVCHVELWSCCPSVRIACSLESPRKIPRFQFGIDRSIYVPKNFRSEVLGPNCTQGNRKYGRSWCSVGLHHRATESMEEAGVRLVFITGQPKYGRSWCSVGLHSPSRRVEFQILEYVLMMSIDATEGVGLVGSFAGSVEGCVGEDAIIAVVVADSDTATSAYRSKASLASRTESPSLFAWRCFL